MAPWRSEEGGTSRIALGENPSAGAHSTVAGWATPARVALSVVALSLASMASLAVWFLPVRLGIDVQPYAVVTDVMPGSPAWLDGIRPSQRVTRIVPMDRPGWLVRTRTADGSMHETSEETHASRRLVQLAAASTGLIAALISIPSAWRRRRSGAAAACLSLFATGFSLALSGFAISVAAHVLAGIGIATLLYTERRIPAMMRIAGAIALLGVTVGWLAVRQNAPELFATAEVVRIVATLGAAMVVVAPLISWRSLVPRRPISLATSTDAIILALFIGVATFLMTWFGMPAWLSALLAVAVAALFSPLRRAVAEAADAVIWSGARDLASLKAVELERTRLFMEIHDGPLQELAAVARDLDDQSDHAAEAERLRHVATELRRLVAQLSPPVLDDLGLVAALQDLAELESAHGSPVVVIRARRGSPLRAQRPPGDVELAAYRIAQEAITNSQRHARASRVVIDCHVAADSVHLSIADNGSGKVTIRTMDGHGRGMQTMRRRASMIGAALDIRSRPCRGTVITLTWEAQQ